MYRTRMALLGVISSAVCQRTGSQLVAALLGAVFVRMLPRSLAKLAGHSLLSYVPGLAGWLNGEIARLWRLLN